MSDDDTEMRKLIERAQAPRSKRSTRVLRAIVLVLVGILIGVILGRASVMTDPVAAVGWSGPPGTPHIVGIENSGA
jgi:hypothetical protein